MDPVPLLAATLAVAAGSVVQAFSGVGAGFIIVPLLALIDVSLIPAPVVLGSIALSSLMAWRERGAIHRQFIPAMLAGILPGAFVGAYVLSKLPVQRLSLLFGAMLLLAIAISLSGRRIPLTHGSALVAGAIGGAMGASSGFGAPALAILYQHESGPRIRATLALLYTGASLMILGALAAFGKFTGREAVAGASLVPGYLLGYALAGRVTRRMNQRLARLAALGVAALAAAALLWRGIFATAA